MGWGSPRRCSVTQYVGEWPNREQWHLLLSLPVFSHFPSYPQSNWAPLVLIPSGWACVHSRTLWVSPTNSSVRLGVSPAAASTPIDVFSQRFEALFPTLEPGFHSLSPQLFLSVYLHANVGPLLHQPLPPPVWSSSCFLVSSPLHPATHLHLSYQSG